MKKFCFKSIFLSWICLFSLAAANAGIRMDVKLDSVHLVMGRSTVLHLEVTKPKDAKGNLTLFNELRQDGIIPVCGDSVEFRAPKSIDTIAAGNNVTLKYEIPVQAFDSGYYQLPELLYVSGNDTARSKRLSLKVIPVQAKADDQINDYASVADPEDKSIFDYLPDWLVDYWWLVVIILALAAAAFYLLQRYRKEGHILPKKPEPTPFEKAMDSLRHLKEQKLWEQGMEKEYYTDLTDILRNYLSGRFGINAMEMTSREILQAFAANDEIKRYRGDMRGILDMADFVKFAKVRPLPEDNIKSFDNALAFVRDTKPVPKPEDADVSKSGEVMSDNKKKGGKK